MENAEEILQALDQFQKLRPTEIPKELEDYLCWVAKTGEPLYQWNLIKILFREKLSRVMNEFQENCPNLDLGPPCPNTEVFNYDAMKTSLLDRLEGFSNAPFTVQRICELLTDPRKEYNRIDKFMRAVEKNILVVSTKEPSPPGSRRPNASPEQNGEAQLQQQQPQQLLMVNGQDSPNEIDMEPWTKTDNVFLNTAEEIPTAPTATPSFGFTPVEAGEFTLEVSESRTFIEVQKIDAEPIIPTDYLEEEPSDKVADDPLSIPETSEPPLEVEEKVEPEKKEEEETTNISPENSSSSSELETPQSQESSESSESPTEEAPTIPDDVTVPEMDNSNPPVVEESVNSVVSVTEASVEVPQNTEQNGEKSPEDEEEEEEEEEEKIPSDESEENSMEAKQMSCEELPVPEKQPVMTKNNSDGESMDVDGEVAAQPAEPMEQEVNTLEEVTAPEVTS